ncbi:MAG: acylneuraminate cytidylyltransferase family protein, partial [Elusimicrobiota bacterium]
MKPRILAVTLARGGSKGVPRKNIRLLAGRPLIAYTIAEARRSRMVTRLIVSSDDDEIRQTAVRYGAEAPFVRPAELSTDTARAVDCDRHALLWAEADEGKTYDFFVELMCTNPM